MMKNNKKIVMSLLTLSLITGTLCLSPIRALEDATEKEEVVYINLNEDGSMQQCYVVNIMYPEDNIIVDYGNYSSIKNLTTQDQLDYSQGKIRGKTSENELYYQGYLDNVEIPWNIDISYYLNGKEISSEDVAGSTGQLKIKMNISENKKCQKEFFNSYALQANVTLDTNLCRHIVADGATIANVGSDKQLTYTILPGKSKNIEISADVTDFRMNSITINGVKLNLGIDTDSIQSDKLDQQIKEIQNAVKELNDGSKSLDNGAFKLNKGATDLQVGMAKIQKGLKELESQKSSLTKGSSEVKTALTTINQSLAGVNMSTNDLTTLSQSSSAISQGINNLVLGLEAMNDAITTYESQLNGQTIGDVENSTNIMITALQNMVDSGTLDTTTKQQYMQIIQLLKAGSGSEKVLKGLQAQLSNQGQVMSGAKTLQTQYQLFDNEIQKLVQSLGALSQNMTLLKGGVNTLLENYSQLDSGINDYTQGVSQIVEGYAQVYNGSLSLVDGTHSLYSGTQSMVKGTNEFHNETIHMDQKVNDSIEDMINNLTGSDSDVDSFVSQNNKEVKGVQFVMKTSEIEKKEDNKKVSKEVKEKTIWEKILAFFKIN